MCVCIISVGFIIIPYHEIEPSEPEVLFKSNDRLEVIIIEEEHLEILELVKVLQHINILSTKMQLQAILHILVIPPFPNNLLQRSRHNLTRADRFLHLVHTKYNTSNTHTIHTRTSQPSQAPLHHSPLTLFPRTLSRSLTL